MIHVTTSDAAGTGKPCGRLAESEQITCQVALSSSGTQCLLGLRPTYVLGKFPHQCDERIVTRGPAVPSALARKGSQALQDYLARFARIRISERNLWQSALCPGSDHLDCLKAPPLIVEASGADETSPPVRTVLDCGPSWRMVSVMSDIARPPRFHHKSLFPGIVSSFFHICTTDLVNMARRNPHWASAFTKELHRTYYPPCALPYCTPPPPPLPVMPLSPAPLLPSRRYLLAASFLRVSITFAKQPPCAPLARPDRAVTAARVEMRRGLARCLPGFGEAGSQSSLKRMVRGGRAGQAAMARTGLMSSRGVVV
eukprot:747268-Hanusia_phi.AAC.6